MTQRLEIKRGDTLRLDCQALDSDGDPIDGISAWSIRSQIRSKAGALIADLAVSITDEAESRYQLAAVDEVTQTFPVGWAAMDIEYTDPDGVVQSTETIDINIIADVTR